ncbi:WSSV339 [White spot syndrome virus]|uniref:WSSV339 n=1 Tax=White spot syndrome virus TaxID=342409 RepID=A0A2I6SC37_9VIRU|nr:WSSV339 [White spot syndrome virus]
MAMTAWAARQRCGEMAKFLRSAIRTSENIGIRWSNTTEASLHAPLK